MLQPKLLYKLSIKLNQVKSILLLIEQKPETRVQNINLHFQHIHPLFVCVLPPPLLKWNILARNLSGTLNISFSVQSLQQENK